jgi:hypothetical protein
VLLLIATTFLALMRIKTHTYRLVLFCLLTVPYYLCAQERREPEPHKHSKLAPSLQNQSRPGAVPTLLIKVSNSQLLLKQLEQQNSPAALIPTTRPGIFKVEQADAATLLFLRSSEHVLYIDTPDRVATTERRLPYSIHTANTIALAHSKFPHLHGSGLTVSVKENSFDKNDIDFKGRVVASELFNANQSVHATDIATIIAGAGNSAPTGKGIAWQARLATSSFAELMPDHLQHLLSQNVSVQNHAYGVGLENYYGLEAEAYDAQCLESPALLHVFSSGNRGNATSSEGMYANIEGFANLTGQFKVSKNTLTVGAADASGQLAALSSRGPAYDGRIKPELIALGAGGTSEAAALVSGIALLAQQAYQQQYNSLPPASLVKAALINNADDLNHPGPDFGTGFGTANASNTLQSILNRQFIIDSIQEGGSKVFSISVPAGMQHFKATIVWHDLAGTPGNSIALVNDLDLEIYHPASGTRWQPWVLNTHPHPDSLQLPSRRGTDRINNVEQVTFTGPEAGIYELKIQGHKVQAGAQAFSLVYTFSGDFEWVYPAMGSALKAGTVSPIKWQGKPAEGHLEYSIAGSGKWNRVSESNTNGLLNWQVPDTTARMLLRLSTSAQIFVSDTFFVYQPINMQVGFTCDEQAMFYWPAQKGVQKYQVYRLEESYMEPLLLTRDTLAIVPFSKDQPQYYAIAPVIENHAYGKGPAASDRGLDTDCYFVSFVPRSLVADTVELRVQLASLYQLEAAHLERLDNGIFRTLQSINPLTDLTFSFTDTEALPGRNEYRVRLSTATGATYYSSTEAVFYTGQSTVMLFPNPVARGEELQVIAGKDDALNFSVYDITGRLLFTSESLGMIKTLPTQGLLKGAYVLKIHTVQGKQYTRRFLVY